MEDPRVQEAIQNLQTGHATEEDARIAFEAGYQGGPNTQAYYKELGLLDPPQDVVSQDIQTTNAMAGDPRYGTRHTSNAMQGDPRFQTKPEAQPSKFAGALDAAKEKFNNGLNTVRTGLSDATTNMLGAWSPLAPSILKGGDMSGEAKGERAKADIYTHNAAENAKILQWNKQRAMDNTLADKVAAAQAQGKWKQNANALGAEGGASVVASQNEAVTPDIMAQKQYQSQQMSTATQNLAEVNRNKLEANAARQNANMTDYNTQYNESKDAYVTNLATTRNAQNKDTEEKKEEPETETTTPETTEKPDGKVEDTSAQNNEAQAAAETNQQSQATETATQEVSDDQKLKDLADEIEGIHKAVEKMKSESTMNVSELKKQKARYDEIKPLFDELAAKSKNPPPTPAPPDFGMFNKELSKVPEAILTGVNQRF